MICEKDEFQWMIEKFLIKNLFKMALDYEDEEE